MSFIGLEFSLDNEIIGASFQVNNHSVSPSSNVKDDDNADDESEYSESEPVPPRFCPYPGMCFNYEYDPDMCDKCGGF